MNEASSFREASKIMRDMASLYDKLADIIEDKDKTEDEKRDAGDLLLFKIQRRSEELAKALSD